MASFLPFDSPSSMIMSDDVRRHFLPYIHIHFFEAGITRNHSISISVHATFVESEFLERIYPELALRNAHNISDLFINRIILSTRDFDVDMLNRILLGRLNGPAHIFNSFDHTDLNHIARDRDGMTTEYLRTIAVASLPPGALHVRIGCLLMLMSNLDPQHGLRSGARMTLLRAGHRCLEVRLLGGEFDGQSQLIYRQSLSTVDNLPFRLTRRQFPVKLAFALNIYKSQGRSFEHVGIVLPY